MLDPTVSPPCAAPRGIELRPGDVLGRWRVLERLGRGGMGVVYRAEAGGEERALKVVHPHLVARPDLLRRFRREAEAGARVRHPNVARTYGLETALLRGAPVHGLVMELVRGRTLMELQLEQGRLAEGDLREFATGVARGLEAIHAAGIVHRDLKPENVMVTARREAKVMDLGVAWSAGEEASLDPDGAFLGSLLFAAPERLRGAMEGPGPSADLYALGCALHQLAVGSHLLEGLAVSEVVEAHRSRPFPRVSASVPGISPFFDAVVATLLEKDPARRFPDARSLRETLEAGEASPWWAARRAGPEARAAAAPALVGRTRELGALAEEWRKARAGAGLALLLTGPEGVGRTAIVDAFLAAAAPGRAGLLRADPGGRLPDAPFAWVRAAFADALPCSARPEDLADLVPRRAALAPALAAALRDGGSGLSAADLEPVAGAAALLLVALARRSPRLVVLDDADRAGEGDRAFLRAAAALAPREPFLVLATATCPVDEAWLATLRSTGGLTEMPVPRLEGDDLRRALVAAVGLPSTAEAVAPVLLPRVSGLPGALGRAVRAWAAAGVLVRGPDGRLRATGAAPPPPADDGTAPRALRAFDARPPEARAWLEAAAVQGPAFDAAAAAHALGRGAAEAARAFADLAGEPRLVAGEGRVMRFDPPEAAEAIRSRVPSDRLALLHRRTAEAFAREAQEGRLPRAAAAPRAAEHYLRGGAPALAAAWIPLALDLLDTAGAGAESLALCALALESADGLPVAVRGVVHERRAAALRLRGRGEEEREALEAAIEAHRSEGRPAPAVLQEAYGGCLVALQDLRAAQAWFAAELAGPEEDAGAARRAVAEGMLSRLALVRGEARAARAHAERSLLAARAGGDPARESSALGHLAASFERAGRLDRAADHLRARLALHARAGRSPEAVDAALGLARLAVRSGRWAEAAVHLDRAEHGALALGYRRGLGRARHGAGLVALARGRLAQARDLLSAAAEQAASSGRARDEALASSDLARACAWLGDADRARAASARALGAAGRRGAPDLLGAVQVACGDVALDLGDPDEAVRWHRDALAPARGAPSPALEAAALGGLAAVALARGHADRSAPDLEAALAAAERAGAPGPRAVAVARRALAPGGDAVAAVRCLACDAESLTWRERLEVRFALAQATGDPWHAQAAEDLRAAALACLCGPDRAAFEAGPLGRGLPASRGLA